MRKITQSLCFIFFAGFSASAQTTNTSPLPAGETVIGGHFHAGYNNEVWTDAAALYFNYRGNATTTYFWNAGNTAGGSIMTLLSNGKVGIGINPTQKLDVVGRLKFRSDGSSSSSSGVWFTGNDGTETAFFGQTNTTSADPIGIWHGGAWRFSVMNNGYVGIGTTTPSAKLHLSAASRTQALRVYMDGNTSNYLSLGQGNGGAVIDPIGTGMLYLGYDQSTNVILGYGGGKVGIGTGSPDYPLTVNGSIHAKEVRVDLNVPAPDYVFEKDYKLPSLEDIKNYIDQNKHLPEVPSAKEIEQNGVQLGEMNLILLKKIEELTLHIIKQEERIKALESQPKK